MVLPFTLWLATSGGRARALFGELALAAPGGEERTADIHDGFQQYKVQRLTQTAMKTTIRMAFADDAMDATSRTDNEFVLTCTDLTDRAISSLRAEIGALILGSSGRHAPDDCEALARGDVLGCCRNSVLLTVCTSEDQSASSTSSIGQVSC